MKMLIKFIKWEILYFASSLVYTGIILQVGHCISSWSNQRHSGGMRMAYIIDRKNIETPLIHKEATSQEGRMYSKFNTFKTMLEP